MSLLQRIGDAWRKNAPELAGLWNGALPSFVLARNPRHALDGIPVFSYHLVEEYQFEADLEFLKRNHYRTLRAEELLACLDGSAPSPERAVVLTFDDGPANFHQVAWPLLARFGASGIAFIAPGLHADALASNAIDRPMNWQEIAQIAASGLVSFQSHTLESRYVPQWPAPVPIVGCAPALEAARRRAQALPFADDLARSRELLESKLPGARVDLLAFPRYLGTDAAVATARALGFRACFWGLTPGHALNRPGDSLYYISRLNDEFIRRLPGEGRITIGAMLKERLRRIRAARHWRQRYGST